GEAGRLERLGVDLPEDVLLGEVLRPDRDRLALVGGIGLDQAAGDLLGGLRAGALAVGRARGLLVVVAARGGGEREGEDCEQRQDGAGRASHGASVRRLSGTPTDRGIRGRHRGARSGGGVSRRCTRPSAASVASVMSATTIAAPSWPASP